MELIQDSDIKQQMNKKSSVDIKGLFEKSILKTTDEFKEPPVCLTIGYEETESIVCTLGNLSLVTGKSKSRKTYFVSAIAAAFLKDGTVLGFRSHLPSDKRKILYIDTEQGKFHCNKVLKRIAKAGNFPETFHPDNLTYLSLRQHSPDIRHRIAEYAINNINNLGVVIIDGIRDLLFSFNDETQSITLVTDLMKWSLEKEIHILTVLHQNKNDENARGHLGSELTNKAESILTVIKDGSNKDISIIRSNLRDRDFNDVAFGVDDDDTPIIKIDFQPKPEKSKFNDPAKEPDQLHLSLLEFIFKESTQYSKNNFFRAIQKHAKNSDIDLSDHKARAWAEYYLEKEFVINSGSDSRNIITLNHVN